MGAILFLLFMIVAVTSASFSCAWKSEDRLVICSMFLGGPFLLLAAMAGTDARLHDLGVYLFYFGIPVLAVFRGTKAEFLENSVVLRLIAGVVIYVLSTFLGVIVGVNLGVLTL